LELDGEPFSHLSMLKKNGTLVTDVNGVLKIPVGVRRAQSGFKVRIGFREFAFIAETSWSESTALPSIEQIARPGAEESTPGWFSGGLRPEWLGGQSTQGAAAGWGWRARRQGEERDTFELPEFRRWAEWNVPATPQHPGLWSSIPKPHRPFSIHHEKEGQAEIVLFALRFCPPIYRLLGRAIEWVVPGRAGTPRRITEEDRRLGMVMISRYDAAPQVPSGGRDFGIFIPEIPPGTSGTRWTGAWRRHTGIDLSAEAGETPVFAITSGRVTLKQFVGGYGNAIQMRLDAHYDALYAHLAHPALPACGSTVRAGQQIGVAGRTFKQAEPSYPNNTPTHLHFELVSGIVSIAAVRVEPVEWLELHGLPRAEWLLPHNEMLRLLPCDCSVPDDVAPRCARRGGTSTLAATKCWAAKNELCPYKPTP
jgi:hypothetical protein